MQMRVAPALLPFRGLIAAEMAAGAARPNEWAPKCGISGADK
jgi:hypothetical protein